VRVVPEGLFPAVESHLIDANFFIRFERHGTVELLERAVTDHDIILLLPQRVYEELTPESASYDRPPVDTAIAAGWATILEEPAYGNPVVSATMDLVRRYIAAATERPEHTIEQADAAVGGTAATILEGGETESVAIYTNDRAAFRGIERALGQHGYSDHVQLVQAFDFVERVESSYQL